MQRFNLQCERCHAGASSGLQDLVERLRGVGLLHRATDPPAELVQALVESKLPQLVCDACGHAGLRLGEADVTEDADWQQAVVCELCHQPIAPERLEIFPTARRCTACQDLADRGAEPEEPEFCEKCGAVVELRVSQGRGLTRYQRFCTGSPPCRL